MSIKFGDFEDIKQFDKERTLGVLTYLACEPRFRFEEIADPETGELKSVPTDEVVEYDVLVNSSVAKGNITITVPPTATGVEVDEDKAYRKPVTFVELSARLWENRSRQMVNGQERVISVTGTKFRASDFKVDGFGGNSQPKEENKANK